MKALQIADSETMRIALQQEICRSDESRYDHRLHGVLLVYHGHSCYDVADWFGEHPSTIERWVHRFEDRGLTGLREGQQEGRPRRLDDRSWEKLERDLRVHPRDLGCGQNLWDGKLLPHHLSQRYAIELGIRQCQRLFRSLGFRRRKPRPLIAQADPEAQQAFKKLAGLAKNPALDFWSLDECHFQQHGSRCAMWVPPEETDPVVLHAPTRKSVALFGAVNLHGGQMIAHFNPVFEAPTFLAFLQGLLKRRAHGKKMVVLIDNAAYHHAAALNGWLQDRREVLQLLFLPPYSPELNPIERVWKLLRRLCTHNEYFPELELLENALTQQLKQWWKPNHALKRLCCIT